MLKMLNYRQNAAWHNKFSLLASNLSKLTPRKFLSESLENEIQISFRNGVEEKKFQGMMSQKYRHALALTILLRLRDVCATLYIFVIEMIPFVCDFLKRCMSLLVLGRTVFEVWHVTFIWDYGSVAVAINCKTVRHFVRHFFYYKLKLKSVLQFTIFVRHKKYRKKVSYNLLFWV